MANNSFDVKSEKDHTGNKVYRVHIVKDGIHCISTLRTYAEVRRERRKWEGKQEKEFYIPRTLSDALRLRKKMSRKLSRTALKKLDDAIAVMRENTDTEVEEQRAPLTYQERRQRYLYRYLKNTDTFVIDGTKLFLRSEGDEIKEFRDCDFEWVEYLPLAQFFACTERPDMDWLLEQPEVHFAKCRPVHGSEMVQPDDRRRKPVLTKRKVGYVLYVIPKVSFYNREPHVSYIDIGEEEISEHQARKLIKVTGYKKMLLSVKDIPTRDNVSVAVSDKPIRKRLPKLRPAKVTILRPQQSPVSTAVRPSKSKARKASAQQRTAAVQYRANKKIDAAMQRKRKQKELQRIIEIAKMRKA